MVNTWLAAFSVSGSPFTLPELNMLQSDAPTAGDTHTWLTHTSPSLPHTWLGLKTGTWSWCPLSWGHFSYSRDNWVTHQRLPVTPQHVLSTDWSLQLIFRSLPCYYSPLYAQLWSRYIPWLTVHYHTMTKAVISLLQVANAIYSNLYRNLCCSHPRVICQTRNIVQKLPEAFYIEKVTVNVLKVHLCNVSL